MSKTEILKELESLTPEDRHEIRDRIDELDDPDDEWDNLPQAERDMIIARIADMEKNPGRGIPLEEAKKELLARYRK